MKISKVLSKIRRKIIFLYDGLNAKKYMKKYNKWLFKNGIDISKDGAKYIHHTVSFDGVDYSRIHIGRGVVISREVTILIHDFSIEAGLESVGLGNPNNEARFIKNVSIGDNTFIGAKCILLPGTNIGKNCIVGAGSVLPGKHYPDYSIVAGNPARLIGNTKEWTKKKINENTFTRGNIN